MTLRKVLRSFTVWCVALVAVAAVAVILHPHGSGEEARIAHLESLVRCPACHDLSVAESNATSAIAVRNEITAAVKSGRSDNEILTSLEDSYGTSILLSPPTSGLGVLLFLVPSLGVVLLVGSAVRLTRRR
ncbi:MAG TPA: cytochrome c-type biogenesis protein CcmH [Acidimicrobiales bacterium]|nr:cytochrome c-type biogenesis protein CcmH [Acidimicrobiales bacterium]